MRGMTYLKRCMWEVAKHLSPKGLDAVEGRALNLSRQLPEPNELAEYGWEDESQP